jgi:DtxR family Mn-dependent transcriptional regulator
MSLHEIHREAEMLEHQTSEFLAEKISAYLGDPAVDPHGDPIPQQDGTIQKISRIQLVELPTGKKARLVSVGDSSKEFLQYLDKTGISIGADIEVIDRVAYDNSLEIRVNDSAPLFISNIVGEKPATNCLLSYPSS